VALIAGMLMTTVAREQTLPASYLSEAALRVLDLAQMRVWADMLSPRRLAPRRDGARAERLFLALSTSSGLPFPSDVCMTSSMLPCSTRCARVDARRGRDHGDVRCLTELRALR
jgi:hypothetical protein